MELKPKLPTFRSTMFSAAVIFGGFAAVKLLHHDLTKWALVVRGLLGAGFWLFAAVVDWA
jgi:hypothetical protein